MSDEVGTEKPAAWRAWGALVWLSLARQARARQMVAIAVGLVAVSTLIVGFLTLTGRWSMARWRYPTRRGVTLPVFADKAQILINLLHPTPGGQAVSAAVFGTFRLMVSRDVRDDAGHPIPGGGFIVFSRAVVFLVFLGFLLPLWSLSFATEAIGGERESGGLLWLLTRPIPRPAIYLARFVALLPWALGLNLGGFALLCLAAGPPGRLALSLFWPAVFWATLTFASLFLLIGAWFRRPAIVALLYSFCLEMIVGNLPGYLKRASVSFYARCMMFDQATEYGIQPEKPSVFLPVDATTALAVLASATVVLLGLGMWLFSRTEYNEVD